MNGPCIPKTTADAVRQQVYAARNRAVARERASIDPIAARWALREADDMENYAADFLALPADSIESRSRQRDSPGRRQRRGTARFRRNGALRARFGDGTGTYSAP